MVLRFGEGAMAAPSCYASDAETMFSKLNWQATAFSIRLAMQAGSPELDMMLSAGQLNRPL